MTPPRTTICVRVQQNLLDALRSATCSAGRPLEHFVRNLLSEELYILLNHTKGLPPAEPAGPSALVIRPDDTIIERIAHWARYDNIRRNDLLRRLLRNGLLTRRQPQNTEGTPTEKIKEPQAL